MIKTILKLFGTLLAILLVGILGLYVYLASLNGKRAEQLAIFKNKIAPIYFAHRGGAVEAPENTIPAFENSVAKGIDVLELDVRASKDGVLVVFHDSDMNRTTNGSGQLKEKNLDELKELDAAYLFSKETGFPLRGSGVVIPTLREVFEKFPERALNIEIKEANPALAAPLCSLIGKFERKENVIVASTDSVVLETFRNNCKGVATSASFRESLWFVFLHKIGLSENFSADMQALQVPEKLFGMKVVTEDFIRAAHERGLKLHIWTANQKSDIKRLVEAGVDGVMTDRPGLIREAL